MKPVAIRTTIKQRKLKGMTEQEDLCEVGKRKKGIRIVMLCRKMEHYGGTGDLERKDIVV